MIPVTTERDVSTSVAAGALPSARVESAVSPSTYAVPGRFLWLADALIQLLALLAAWRLAPMLQLELAAERAGRLPGFRWLALQPGAAAAGLRPFLEIVWIPLVTVPATLLVMQALGGYRPLLEQSRTRVVLTSVVAPLVGLSLVTLMLVTIRNQSTSRALLFSFALLTTVGFLSHRSATRRYKSHRLRAGHYTRNVVVVAPPAALRWLSEHFAQHVSPTVRRLYGYLEIPGMALSSPGLTADSAKSQDPPRLGDVRDLGELLVHKSRSTRWWRCRTRDPRRGCGP